MNQRAHWETVNAETSGRKHMKSSKILHTHTYIHFLNRTPFSQKLRPTAGKWDLIKVKKKISVEYRENQGVGMSLCQLREGINI